jgi:hypothetical protein
MITRIHDSIIDLKIQMSEEIKKETTSLSDEIIELK